MLIKTRRWVKRIVLCTAAVVLVGAGVTIYLLQRPPAVWTQAQELLDKSTPAEREQAVSAVMDRLSKMVGESTVRSGDGQGFFADSDASGRLVDHTYELELNNEELVAMVSAFFADWMAQRGYEVPDAIGTPVVMVDEDRLAFAIRVTTPSWQQVFSGYADLTFTPDGMAHGRVDELRAGSLPVSVTAVADMVRKQLPQSEAVLADKIGGWLAELEDFEFRPVLELKDRRRARVVAMGFRGEGVVLTMRVQDHVTYKRHNALMHAGQLAVTDELSPAVLPGGAFADVPTTTD